MSELPQMTIQEAAEALHAQFMNHGWFVAVGVGSSPKDGPMIYLYTRTKRPGHLNTLTHWAGFPVIVQQANPVPR